MEYWIEKCTAYILNPSRHRKCVWYLWRFWKRIHKQDSPTPQTCVTVLIILPFNLSTLSCFCLLSPCSSFVTQTLKQSPSSSAAWYPVYHNRVMREDAGHPFCSSQRRSGVIAVHTFHTFITQADVRKHILYLHLGHLDVSLFLCFESICVIFLALLASRGHG